MISLNKITKYDFLDDEKMAHLKELGVDTSDSTYCIIEAKVEPLNKFIASKNTFIKSNAPDWNEKSWQSEVYHWENFNYVCDTYTLPQLLFKLSEWLGNDGYKGLSFFKDAPFYCFFYDHNEAQKIDDSCVYGEDPLSAAYNLLCWCIEHDYSYIGSIRGKYER